MSESGLGIEKAVGSSVPVVSPTSGDGLVRNNENGLYHDKWDGSSYIVGENGKIVHLKDPMSGGELIPNADGTFLSKSTGGNFALNNEHFIPLYIPDKTLEPAHIDNGRLIANETGRTFEIDEKGVILTPGEIEKRRINQVFTDKVDALKDEIERRNQEVLMEMLKQPVLEGETVEQRNQRVMRKWDEFTQKLGVISEEYFRRFDEIKREVFFEGDKKTEEQDMEKVDTNVEE